MNRQARGASLSLSTEPLWTQSRTAREAASARDSLLSLSAPFLVLGDGARQREMRVEPHDVPHGLRHHQRALLRHVLQIHLHPPPVRCQSRHTAGLAKRRIRLGLVAGGGCWCS
jgi:hypothetical protein